MSMPLKRRGYLRKDKMKTEYQYFRFEETPGLFTAKTKAWTCKNRKSGGTLGWVQWENGWRQYVFTPDFECIFSTGCLKDIQDFITQAMAEHKQKSIST